MPCNMAIDIHCNGQACNMRGHSLDIDRKRSGFSAEALRPDAERIDLSEHFIFQLRIKLIRIALVGAAHQCFFCKQCCFVERSAESVTGNVSYNQLTDVPVVEGFSGNYDDLSGKPELFSGDYNDLTNLPNLFSGRYADLTGKPSIADSVNKYTFSGSYNDLTFSLP